MILSPSVLLGNLLTLSDSDFESGTLTWAADTNASAPAASASFAFTGAKALLWSASAAGDSIVSTGFYKAAPNNGYVISGYLNTITAGGHDAFIGVRWYDSGHTHISDSWGNNNPSDLNVWQPMSAAVTSPSNAAFFKVAVWVSLNVAISEQFAVDLVYAADSNAQVLIDWHNATYAAGSAPGQDFTDITPWVRLDQNITVTRGRQDAVSEIQAGQATFQVQNDNGWFTPQLSSSPYFPDITLGARVQINATDQNGVWHTRFDGALSQITYTVDVVGGTNTANFSASDVLAFLGRSDPVQVWTKEVVELDSPFLHWTLNDNGDAKIAAETSGTNGPVLRVVDFASGSQVAAIAWGSSNGGVETLADASVPGQPDGSQYWLPGLVDPNSRVRGLASGGVGPIGAPLGSVQLTPALTVQSAENQFVGTDGYQLNAELYINGVPASINASGGTYSVECWFMMDPAIQAHLGQFLGPFTVLSLGNGRTGACLVAGLYYSGASNLNFEVANYSQPPAFPYQAFGSLPTPTASVASAITADLKPVPHHLVIEISAGAVTVYLDNNSIGSFNLPAGSVYDTICVGGAYGGHGNFYGNISLLSVYSYLLSPAQIEMHAMAGQYGFWEQTTDNCIGMLGEIAGIPRCWNGLGGPDQSLGLSLTEYLNIGGTNALSSMQLYEQAEGGGLLFVNNGGQLTFHPRDWRMGYGAPDLALPSDSYNADLGYELIDNFLLNEASIATATFTTGVDFSSAVSQGQYGNYANGTQDAPVQLPLITWSRAYAGLGLPSYGFWRDPNLADLAAWQANTRSAPRLVCGQLTVDLLTVAPSWGVSISDFYGVDVDNMITLNSGWGPIVLSGGHAPGVIEPDDCAVVAQSLATTMKIGDTFRFTAGPNAGSQIYTVSDVQPPFAGFVNILFHPNSPVVPSTSDTIDQLNVPVSFPDQTGALDYFIEGINEIIGLGQRALTFYTSPASTHRAWKPGDAVYGQLGVTSRIGVSAPDVNTPAALGKSVSHDGGTPFWPPSFTATPDVYQMGWGNISTGTAATINVSMPSNPGDCIMVQVLAAAAATVTIADSQGNTYTQNTSVTFGTHVQYIFTCFRANTLGTSDSITVTGSVSQAYTTSAYDISDVTALDATAKTATGTSATPAITGNVMSATNDFEMVLFANAANSTVTIPGGWTQIGWNFQNPYQNQIFWRQATSTSADAASATLSGGSTAWGAIALSFSCAAFTLNNPANNGHSFIGATEIRGIRDTLAVGLNPPMLVAGCINNQQTVATGNGGVNNRAIWDTVYIDTAGGMSIVPGWPNWYAVTVPGFYEISASFVWGAQATGAAGVRTAWVVIAQAAAQKVAAGTGSPFSDTYVCPIGEQVTPNNVSRNAACAPVTRVYLGVGDMVNIGLMQNQGSSQVSSNLYHGSLFSMRWVGYNTSHDQKPVALAPGSGVASVTAGKTAYIQSWNATNTYSYFGTAYNSSIYSGVQLRNTNGQMFQGEYGKKPTIGSQFSIIDFPNASIVTALSGATINRVWVTFQNIQTYHKTGTYMMLGWTSFVGTPGNTFAPGTGTHFDSRRVFFRRGQTRKAEVTGAGIGTAFQTGSATGLVIGNNSSKDPVHWGTWQGGGNPVLTIEYSK